MSIYKVLNLNFDIKNYAYLSLKISLNIYAKYFFEKTLALACIKDRKIYEIELHNFIKPHSFW